MRLILLLACLLFVALTLAPSQTPAAATLAQATMPPAPTTPPIPTPPAAPTAPSMPSPPAMPSAPAMPTAPAMSPMPAASPMATPTVLMLAPDAAPQILAVRLSSTTPHAGDALDVKVLTSSNVASVELRVGGYGASMSKTDVGRFEMTSTVPRLPFFMSHNLTLQIIARNTAGVAVSQNVPLQVR